MHKLLADLKRLWRHAAIVGAVLAIICQVVPSQYRVVCDALVQLCRL